MSHLKGWKFWDSSSESQTERPALSECTAPRVSLLHVFPLLVEDGRDVFDFGDPWDFVGCRHAGHYHQPRLLLHLRQFAVVSCRTVFLVVDGDAASGCLLSCRRGRRCWCRRRRRRFDLRRLHFLLCLVLQEFEKQISRAFLMYHSCKQGGWKGGLDRRVAAHPFFRNYENNCVFNAQFA